MGDVPDSIADSGFVQDPAEADADAETDHRAHGATHRSADRSARHPGTNVQANLDRSPNTSHFPGAG
ncbi:hypothetical protein [Arthrobacter rhombi]|uniref:hypothetical protein n=1 Tax=Arthrobacter rhombi TaxID=71253 RepID=UPI003FD049FB